MRVLGEKLDHSCAYCKDGITWCFGPTPSKGSGLTSLICQNCITKYEAIEDKEERKKAIEKDAFDRINGLLNELFNLCPIFMEYEGDEYPSIAANKEMCERLCKAVKTLMGWDQKESVAPEEPSEPKPTP